MILSMFFLMLYSTIWLITSPLRLLPNVSLPANITDSISSASTYLAALNSVIPTNTILIIIGLVLSLESFIILWKIVNWLIHKIPTIS